LKSIQPSTKLSVGKARIVESREERRGGGEKIEERSFGGE
jgi:hypothetical protein